MMVGGITAVLGLRRYTCRKPKMPGGLMMNTKLVVTAPAFQSDAPQCDDITLRVAALD